MKLKEKHAIYVHERNGKRTIFAGNKNLQRKFVSCVAGMNEPYLKYGVPKYAKYESKYVRLATEEEEELFRELIKSKLK